MYAFRRKNFQAEKSPCTHTLKWGHAWHAEETERSPLRL